MHQDGLTTARKAWEQLVSRGSATKYVAQVLSVGIDEHIKQFTDRFLGPDGFDAFKLILGLNGEGKSHFLRCIEAAALERDHVVAFLEASVSGAGESSFAFAQSIMKCVRVSTDQESDEQAALVLLREAIDRKRRRLESDGLDADALLPEWADGFRTKDLHPLDIAQGLSEALQGLISEDRDRTVTGLRQLTLEHAKVTRGEQTLLGPQLLRSLTKLPRLLGFNRLVLLVDEAEVAFEGLSQKRRQSLLGMLRFLNDHLVGAEQGAVILVACTDDFWPAKFNEYAALKGRLTDPGHDRLEDRRGLTPRALINKNKLWIRETFRGEEDEYKTLGDAVLVVGARVLKDLDLAIQTANAAMLARVACSDEVNRVIKRPFVKALAQLVDTQVGDGSQERISEEEARGLFDIAKRDIETVDTPAEEG